MSIIWWHRPNREVVFGFPDRRRETDRRTRGWRRGSSRSRRARASQAPGLEEGAIDDQLTEALKRIEQAYIALGSVELVLLVYSQPRHPPRVQAARMKEYWAASVAMPKQDLNASSEALKGNWLGDFRGHDGEMLKHILSCRIQDHPASRNSSARP